MERQRRHTTTTWLSRSAPLVLTSLMALAPADAAAQTSLQIPLQFDFLNPGAKSLAVGGAFAGLADDATATFANPAGLVQLGASEVSFELRSTWVTTPFLQAGRLSGTVTNQGDDTIAGPVFADSSGSHVGPGFIAGVYMHPSHRWVIAGYRHELARVDQTFFSNGVFQQKPGESSARDLPQEGDRKVSITGYGVAGSYRISPLVAVGAGLAAYTFDMNSVFRRFATDGFFGPPLLNKELGRASQTGDNVGWAPTFGVMIGGDQSRLGIVFRQGASFDLTTNSVRPDGTPRTDEGQFRVPHTLAVGGSFRPKPLLTLAVEVTQIWYSRLREDFVTAQAVNTGYADSFTINNGTEIHGGVQYTVPRWRGVPRFRGGAWFDPDHSVKFSPSATTAVRDPLFEERLSTALSKGENQVHGTGGIGLTFGRHFEVNAAIDIASTTRIFSTSLIVR
jgi:long-subunit fatty acid transport protein